MPVYMYESLNAAGKKENGRMEVANKQELIAFLKSKNLTPLKMEEASGLNKDINIEFLQKKPKPRDMSIFCRQFVSITSAGVAINSTLEMLAEQTENKMLAEVIEECRVSIQTGTALSEAMSYHPKVFPDLFVTMVAAGEVSGDIETAFERMAEQYEKDARIKAAVKKATIYPIIIIIVAVVAIGVMLTMVVPQFESMFADLGSKLPALTQVVVDASEFLQKNIILFTVLIIALVVGVLVFKRTETGKRFFGKLQLKIPAFRQLVVKTSSARCCRTLSTLISAGIPITQAIEISKNVMSNPFFKDAMEDMKEQVALGVPMSTPIEESGLFPPMVFHMTKIGEEVGDLEGMLEKTAQYYEEEVESAVQSLMAALEPMIILLLALSIGVVVIAMILPMGQMMTDMGNI